MLAAAAQARAEANADAGELLRDFDYASYLREDWGVWVTNSTVADAGDPWSLPAATVRGGLQRRAGSLRCEMCTHLGTGVVTRDGRTYATILFAARLSDVEAGWSPRRPTWPTSSTNCAKVWGSIR